jgi:hypothetical protein
VSNGASVPPDVSALRLEIVEAQKSRTDLMKYKLVVAAALGAVALGVGPAAGAKQVPYVVGIIPLVCLYVDAVCDHNDIRMMIIGRYLRSEGLPYFGYETLAQHLRTRFSLERVALDWSSLSISSGLLCFGLVYATRPQSDWTLVWITTTSGALGLFLTLALRRNHRRIMEEISGIDIASLLSGQTSP